MLAGGATFACLLMLKHLFLSLAPLYFVYLLRHYCFETTTPVRTETKLVESHDSSGTRGGGHSKGCVSALGVHADRQPEPHSGSRSQGDAAGVAELRGEHAARFCLKRLASLGAVVVCVFLSALGPQCVSDGWTKEACLGQLNQLAVRLFPFGRSVFCSEGWLVPLGMEGVPG